MCFPHYAMAFPMRYLRPCRAGLPKGLFDMVESCLQFIDFFMNAIKRSSSRKTFSDKYIGIGTKGQFCAATRTDATNPAHILRKEISSCLMRFRGWD